MADKRGNCRGVTLNFGEGSIEIVRKQMIRTIAQIEYEKMPEEYKLRIDPIALADRAYEMCEFKEFDDEDGFYTIK